MSENIRPVYTMWPRINRRLTERVERLTDAELALQPGPDRWPLWATIGHTACQRVFWLCVFAGEPGVESTPFPNSAFDCPGDDDLDTVLGAEQLVRALQSTFRIVEGVLDRWTVESLGEEISQPEWGDDWVHTRGAVIQRVFAHDVSHCSEVDDVLGRSGLEQIDLWS